MQSDVLIIGAGPAGSAAARVLAEQGMDVLLVDQHEFPREKVCGDGLIPDALRALDALGLGPTVRQRAKPAVAIRAFSPNRTQIDVPVDAACIPRRELDDFLLRHATDRGARFLAPYRFNGLIESDGAGSTVIGARFRSTRDDVALEVRARTTLLATGAVAKPLELAGMCLRKQASGFAVRAYYEHADAADTHLCIAFDRGMVPGYGWIFPAPDGRLNIGAGFFHDAKQPPITSNVRELFNYFVSHFPAARRIVSEGRQVSPIKGAPLRTSLEGARFSRPGLLVIGEAAGTTYALSGEGIGKAIESGMLAARLIREFQEPMLLAERYAAAMDRDYRPRYRAYSLAQDWIARPGVANFLAARARSNGEIQRRLRALLAEEVSPREVFAFSAVTKAILKSLTRVG